MISIADLGRPSNLSTKLPAETELAAYRIVMEAMTNVVRHAHAQRCDVEIRTGSDTMRLVVRDDGVGMDPRSTASGLGLRSMQERAHELGGNLLVAPAPKGGTVVTATLPLERPA